MKILNGKTRATAIIAIIVLTASLALSSMPVQAQEDGAHGSMPTGTGSGISGPLPAGATPEVTV